MQGVIYYFDEFDLPMPVAYGALGLGAVPGLYYGRLKSDTWGVKKCVFIMCVIFACGSAAMAIFGKISVIAAVLGFFTGAWICGRNVPCSADERRCYRLR